MTYLRDNLRLTQIEFASLFGVHYMTVSKWERGDLSPSNYQKSLMRYYLKASKKREVQLTTGLKLIVEGVPETILFLLTNAKEMKKNG